MTVIAKIIFSIGALILGPATIVLLDPFIHWKVTAGLMTMAIISGNAVYGVWRKPQVGDRSWLFIAQCWRGEERLWKIFWVVGVGIAVIGKAALYFGSNKAPMIWWILIFALAVPVKVWWIVSVWRCSKNTDKKTWTWLSRSVVTIDAVNSIYQAFIVGEILFGIK
jgi:hypothetical protein